MTLRERAKNLVEKPAFHWAIVALIVVNAIVLGLETSAEVRAEFGGVLSVVNGVIVAIFVVEIVLRIVAYGVSFFRDPWSLFDLFVVVVALIPASSGSAVLRLLRLLRVLRLLSTVRSMRLVVSAILAALPGILSTGGLLVMIIYIFAVSATTLFGELQPDAFGDLWLSSVSLFRLMLGDGWPDFIAPMAETNSAIWAYFILFSTATTLIVLNLFLAVTVEAMDRMKKEELDENFDEVGDALDDVGEELEKGREVDQQILAELRALRAEVAALRSERVDESG